MRAHLADAVGDWLQSLRGVVAVWLQVLLRVVHVDHGAARDFVRVGPRLVPLDRVLCRAGNAESLHNDTKMSQQHVTRGVATSR